MVGTKVFFFHFSLLDVSSILSPFLHMSSFTRKTHCYKVDRLTTFCGLSVPAYPSIFIFSTLLLTCTSSLRITCPYHTIDLLSTYLSLLPLSDFFLYTHFEFDPFYAAHSSQQVILFDTRHLRINIQIQHDTKLNCLVYFPFCIEKEEMETREHSARS